MTVMKLSSGEILNIGSDIDFWRMLQEKLGSDAAQWFYDRIQPYEEFYKTWKDYIPVDFSESPSKRYRLLDEAIKKLGPDHECALIEEAFELPGWDQY